MSREIDAAQRRIDTGWVVKWLGEPCPLSEPWLVARFHRGKIKEVNGWYGTKSEARAAYLAVTAPCSKP